MLWPRGRRWMQTLRKLPTIVPKTKKTTDQKWNGTPCQLRESKMGLTIDILLEGAAHDFDGGRLAGPDFEGFGALIEEHAESVGGAAACGLCGFEERGFGWTIDHVVNGGGAIEGKLGCVEGQGIGRLEAKGGGVEDEFDGAGRVADRYARRGLEIAQFVGEGLGFWDGSVDEEEFQVVIESELEGSGASGSSGAEHEDFFAVEFKAELFTEGADEGVGVGVKAVGTDFGRRVGKFSEGTPMSGGVFGFEADGVDGAPTTGGVVEGVDEVEGEEFVWDGEVEADEAHGFGAVDGGAQVIGGDIESEVTPIEF